MPRKYQTIIWRGRKIRRRMLTKAEMAERRKKSAATRAAKVTGHTVVRQDKAGTGRPKGDDFTEWAALRKRVNDSLVSLERARKWLIRKYGAEVLDRMDEAHSEAMHAERVLRNS